MAVGSATTDTGASSSSGSAVSSEVGAALAAGTSDVEASVPARQAPHGVTFADACLREANRPADSKHARNLHPELPLGVQTHQDHAVHRQHTPPRISSNTCKTCPAAESVPVVPLSCFAAKVAAANAAAEQDLPASGFCTPRGLDDALPISADMIADDRCQLGTRECTSPEWTHRTAHFGDLKQSYGRGSQGSPASPRTCTTQPPESPLGETSGLYPSPSPASSASGAQTTTPLGSSQRNSSSPHVTMLPASPRASVPGADFRTPLSSPRGACTLGGCPANESLLVRPVSPRGLASGGCSLMQSESLGNCARRVDFSTPLASPRGGIVLGECPANESLLVRPTSPRAPTSHDCASGVNFCTPLTSPRGGASHPAHDSQLSRQGNLLALGASVSDGLALAGKGAWHGWQLQASSDGRVYYYHEASGISQWEMPSDLANILGQWEKVEGEQGDCYWYNKVLQTSCWNDPGECSSLHEAALDGNLAYIHLYTFAGGCQDAVDAKGRTALHLACATGQAEAASLLLEGGANIDSMDQGASTPLHWACRYGQTLNVRLLLDANANPAATNALGDTPMHEAAAVGRVDPLHWLILARANPHHRNLESKSPAETAAARGWGHVEMLLRRHEGHPCWADSMHDEASMHRPTRNVSPLAERNYYSPSPKSHSRLNELGQEDSAMQGVFGDVDTPMSPALKLVRAARPVLRGVQWLANRVLGERHVDLGSDNGFVYDSFTNKWVLHSDGVDSDGQASAISDLEEDDDNCQMADGCWSGRSPNMPLQRQMNGETYSDDALGV
eukprot:TRINITY_DN8125_c0_g1_i1.p1 TRINITY_DN8125_c0_g1~~TRINITY_DN8125_c0_g1_i1.p1  ORF type:complete len:791 (-),score=94.89 TRINITY_DN8125_c0_g1_i1:51-2423(-)